MHNGDSHASAAAFLLAAILACLPAASGEAPPPAPDLIPPAEMQALERAIAREINSSAMGSQILGDLYRLQRRLVDMRTAAKGAGGGKPDAGGDAGGADRKRLEIEAASGNRAALRELAFLHAGHNEPEKAMAIWTRLGRANEHDTAHLIFAAYLELALGEYGQGRRDLEAAVRMLDTRAALTVTNPVFCQNIAGYRLYEPRPAGPLMPGEDVLLYVELEGVDFKSTPDGMSECRVMFGLKLKDENQRTIWAEPNYGEYAPVFAGPIRDLHAALAWRVPNDLEPGRHHIFVEAVEESSKRRGEGAAGFSVGRRETNAEKRPTALPALDPSGLPPGYLDPKSPYSLDRLQREAMKAFPGVAPPTPEPPNPRDPDYHKKFEIIQNHERAQKAN